MEVGDQRRACLGIKWFKVQCRAGLRLSRCLCLCLLCVLLPSCGLIMYFCFFKKKFYTLHVLSKKQPSMMDLNLFSGWSELQSRDVMHSERELRGSPVGQACQDIAPCCLMPVTCNTFVNPEQKGIRLSQMRNTLSETIALSNRFPFFIVRKLS